MNKIFLATLLLFVSNNNLKGQTLSGCDPLTDKLIDLNKYKSLVVKYSSVINGVIETNYFIKNGRIDKFFGVYEKKVKGRTQYPKYDNQGNLSYIEYTDANKKVIRNDIYGLVKPTKDSSNYITVLDNKNRVISRTSKKYDDTKQDGWKTLYEYDNDGKISKEHKINYYLDEQRKKEKVELITKYTYDTYGNITVMDRSESINQRFPINMANAGKRYEKEKYEYLYDQYGNWTHRYFIQDNNEEKILQVERILKKN